MSYREKEITEVPYPSHGSDGISSFDSYSGMYYIMASYKIKFSEKIEYDVTEAVEALLRREVAKARAYEREQMKNELEAAKKDREKMENIRAIANEGICFGIMG